MTEYLTEQEQIDLLKAWIKEYAPVVILGLIIAGIAIFGWNFWQERQARQQAQASSWYQDMISEKKDSPQSQQLAEKIYTKYPRLIYGQMSALQLAQKAVNENKLETAIPYLQAVMKNGTAALKELARTRYARILLAQQKPAESLTLLNTIDDKAFLPLVLEIKGDAYLAQHQVANAKQAYQDALSQLPNSAMLRPILTMKANQLSN